MDNQTKTEKLKKLQKLSEKINDKLGKNIIKKASEHVVKRVNTGIMFLDYLSDGFPAGSRIQIWGEKQSAKSSLVYAMIAGIQRQNGVAMYLDFEHAADPEYMKTFGINMDELFFTQPENMEQGLDFVRAANGNVDMLIIDSIVALGIKADQDKAMDENMKMAGSALKISEFFKQLLGTLNSETSPVLVFINQTRSNVGVMYGPTSTFSGGNALAHALDFSIHMRCMSQKEWPTTKINGKDVFIGKRYMVKVDKSKINANTGKEIAFNMLTEGEHIDNIGSITDIALEKGLIVRSGVTTSYNGIKFIGFDNFKNFVNQTPELQEIMKNHILKGEDPGDLSYFQNKKEEVKEEIKTEEPKETEKKSKKKNK
jgi:recombination protein RecA